ncbi:MAG: hypothetical protein HY581_00135 [Nitrospirae bacterium]|nr:hypothetical protein [Nitrospirota bacterium]
MTTHCRRVGGLLLVVAAVTGLAACITVSAPPSSPFFAPDPREIKFYQTLAREREVQLATCAKQRSCDRVHFTRALVALYENRAVAARHFQDVVAVAPKSNLASSSLIWIRLLEDAPPNDGRASPWAEATERLVHDLLELEVSSAEALQREATVRQKDVTARDEKVQELTKQLEALKRIDQEMKEKSKSARSSQKTRRPAEGSHPPKGQ